MPAMPKDKETGLTELQTRFISELIRNGGNMSKAAESAGYEESSAYQRGWELMQKPNILQAVAKERRKQYQNFAVQSAKWLIDAIDDNTISANVKKDIAFGFMDRAGDKHSEVVEIIDNRSPKEIRSKLALLLGNDTDICDAETVVDGELVKQISESPGGTPISH